jgi:transcriptional regulator with XRE-family HTH domain
MYYSSILMELREKMGWTQSELAEKVGVSQVMISQIEKEVRKPSIKLRKQIRDLVTEFDPALGLDIKLPVIHTDMFPTLKPAIFRLSFPHASLIDVFHALKDEGVEAETRNLLVDVINTIADSVNEELKSKDDQIAELKERIEETTPAGASESKSEHGGYMGDKSQQPATPPAPVKPTKKKAAGAGSKSVEGGDR